jgi:hypothetical protein
MRTIQKKKKKAAKRSKDRENEVPKQIDTAESDRNMASAASF